MNKKDISEIKKLFKKDGGAIDHICGCMIDGEGKRRMEFRDAFYSLSDEEADRYFEIFKKALSGTLGKNLHSLEYTIEQETEGEAYKLLDELRQSALKDDEVLDRFYSAVASTYSIGDSYYVVLLHCNYDVPGKGTDGLEQDDGSEEVYSFFMCCLCPVELSDAGLFYNTAENRVEERTRDLCIRPAANAFLFPAFTDRCQDVHSVLYYAKKPEELHEEFIDGCIGGPTPLSFKSQKEAFQEIVTRAVGGECSFDTACRLQENITELMEEYSDVPEPLKLGKPEVKKLLEKSGASDEDLEQFDSVYEDAAGKSELMAENLVSKKSFAIKTPDIKISINPQYLDLVQIQQIEGQRCIVIPIDDSVEVNGMSVSLKDM